MGVSSSLYSSISGLSSMGEAMSVLGDNVANVNTISFKSSRSTFQDVLSQSVSTASGTSQVGRGVTLSTISGLFAQGSFESSTSPTDMAIGGQGFFMLRSPDSSEADMYTRAGEFSFDQEGYIVNPVGAYAQGWTIDSTTGEQAGTIGDMRIDKTTPPLATQEIEVITNLDSREKNETNELRLFDAWDGRNAASVNPTAPVDSTQFEYTTAIKTYDSKGASHDLTIYFDRTTNDNEWEFLVTCAPSEDNRVLTEKEKIVYVPAETYDFEEHKGAGALMYGILGFDTSGNIQTMKAYNVPPDGKVDPALDTNRMNLSSTDDYYSFEVNFTGDTTNSSMELNLGAQYTGIQSKIKQTLVSELGAVDSNLTGAKYITAETTWANVYDTNGMTLSGTGVAVVSDSITVTGFKNSGERVTSVYNVNTNGKVQDFLDQLSTDFSANATIDAYGRLMMTDYNEGRSGLYITSITVDGDNDGPAINNDANPFGETGVNGDTIVNVTTSKQKILSQGQFLNSSGGVITSASTPWVSVFDDATNQVEDGDVYRFNGFKSDGTAVTNADFTVDTTVNLPSVTGTVQDLLDWLEETFDADAEIDGAGRVVLTDRVADDAATGGYESKLQIDSVAVISAGAGSNPFDDDTQAVSTPFAGTNFLTIKADTSGEDGSQLGTSVSQTFNPEALASTQYANSSATIFQDQNGFASGFLQSVSVDTEGVITGHYSNGQVLKKAQVALANFTNIAGLYKQGGNVFTETTDSGAPVTGTAGSNGLGSIAPNALEMSNVDLGNEFVKLISVQRGFQANSKIITTTDEMMSDLINMKR